ncbi:right-handed parallel beta-helix repeat-containing protein [Streptomyces sp. NPDC002054]|uniref:right-handed parallel beta-helix repeat-containing protein n=1 Tax=Streptomyces sp. NPDC002054 TaxID=3154663 RepID=UPI003329CA73
MQRRSVILAAGGFMGAVGVGQVAAAGPAAAAFGDRRSVYDVLNYGAKGDGTTDDTAAFQAALTDARAVPEGATLLIPPGKYPLTKGLVLGPRMTVSAYGAHIFRTKDCGALVKNFDSVTPASAYEGAGDIALLGGTWDMRGSAFKQQSDAIGFAHAGGILVQDCTVLDTPSAHAVELNAVRRARIVNCLFDGLHVTGEGTDTATNREAVQITGAISAASLPAPAYDNTPCQDIQITGCTLRAGADGSRPFGALVGDHGGVKNVVHRDIRIVGNHIERSAAYGIRTTDWQQAFIAGNTIESVGVTAVQVGSPAGNALNDITITGNIIRNTGTGTDTATGGAIVVSSGGDRHNGITITDNTIRTVKGEAGIYVTQSDGVTISGNTVNGTARPGGNSQGIHVQNAPYAVISGNTVTDAQGDGIGVDSGAVGTLIAHNTVLNPAGHGIAAGTNDVSLRDNQITGANRSGSTATYGIRLGGNAANASCQGNVVRKGDGPVAAEAAIVALPGCVGAWITGNDLRGWGGGTAAVLDRATGTLVSANAM